MINILFNLIVIEVHVAEFAVKLKFLIISRPSVKQELCPRRLVEIFGH